jgi:hypothetical protein
LENLKNSSKSTLSAAINNSITTIVVADGNQFPAANFRILIGTELLLCTAKSGNNLTVERGVEGTTAAAHTNGAKCTMVLTATGLAEFVDDRIATASDDYATSEDLTEGLATKSDTTHNHTGTYQPIITDLTASGAELNNATNYVITAGMVKILDPSAIPYTADAWISGYTYNPGDLALDGSYGIYRCIKTTGSGQTTHPQADATYWLADPIPYDTTMVIGDGGQSITTSGLQPAEPSGGMDFERNNSQAGKGCTFIGVGAGLHSTTGNMLTFVGSQAGEHTTNGEQSTFIGYQAGQMHTDGIHNTAIGCGACQFSPYGKYNVHLGTDSGLNDGSEGLICFVATATTPPAEGDTFTYPDVAGNPITYTVKWPTVGISDWATGNYLTNQYVRDGAYGIYRCKADTYDYPGGGVYGSTTAPHSSATFFQHIASLGVIYATGSRLPDPDAGKTLTFTSGSGAPATIVCAGAYPALSNNTALGSMASVGQNATNISVGSMTGNNTSYGTGNTIVGCTAGNCLTFGTCNIFVGMQSGFNTTTGYGNMFFGMGAGYNNTTGYNNTYIGDQAGRVGTSLVNRTGIGKSALYNNTGVQNTAIGYNALANGTGGQNTAIGDSANVSCTTGAYNVSIGYQSIISGTSAYSTVAIGYRSALNLVDGGNNIFIGYGADSTAHTTNSIVIGQGITCSTDNTILLGNSSTKLLDLNFALPTAADNAAAGALTPAVPVNGLYKNDDGIICQRTTSTNYTSLQKVLSTTTEISLKTLGPTPIYTVPTGKTAIIQEIVVRCTSMTGSGDLPMYCAGANATTYDDYATTGCAVVDVGRMDRLIAGLSLASNNCLFYSAGTVIKFNVISVGDSEIAAMKVAVDVLGYLV